MMHLANLSMSHIFIGLNVLVFFIVQNKPELLQRMLFINNRVRYHREYDRLFLSGFAHAGILHLAFNCITLYFFGPLVERLTGSTLFIFIYLLSIVGGNLYCLLMKREVNSYSALGASGGVMGVIYAFIILVPDGRISLMILPIFVPGWVFGILFSLISIALTQLPRAAEARISHEGHLGGALVGALITLVFNLNVLQETEVLYLCIGGLLPIILFATVKWLAPHLIYRNRG